MKIAQLNIKVALNLLVQGQLNFLNQHKRVKQKQGKIPEKGGPK